MISLLPLLLVSQVSTSDTCVTYLDLNPEQQRDYVGGIQSGFMSGLVVTYKTLLQHELAGQSSALVARTIEAIVREQYKKFDTVSLSKNIKMFCKEDKKGKLRVFRVFLAVTRRMSGGTDEEFEKDVQEMLQLDYTPQELFPLPKEEKGLGI